MDKNTVTGPPPQPQQPPPVQQKSGMQAPPPQMMAHYPVPQPQGGGLDSVPFSKSWHVTKIILGSLSMVFSIIALGLGIYFFSTGLHFRAGFQFGLVGTTVSSRSGLVISTSVLVANDRPPRLGCLGTYLADR